MKFKLVEKLDYNEFSESILSQYLYDAVDELENASLERYIEWFRKEIPEIDQPDEDLFITCVRDAYIQLIDYGEIAQPKTMITSQLKDYIESHTGIIDDTDELMKQCPDHLQHELKIVLSKLDESLTEELLTESINTNLRKFLISLLELSNVDWKSLLNVNSVNDIVVHHIGKDRTANSVNDLALMSDHWHRSMHTKYSGDKWEPSVLKNYPHIIISDLLVHVADNLISQNKQDELAIENN